jgi:hypothetical protein
MARAKASSRRPIRVDRGGIALWTIDVHVPGQQAQRQQDDRDLDRVSHDVSDFDHARHPAGNTRNRVQHQ